MKYFPKDVQNAIGRSFSFDPLPPATASSQYDENYWKGVDSGLTVLGARQAAPDNEATRAALQQLQAFLQANPDMAQRFPGGGNMPQQLLDMLNHGEDIGALWEGLLAELAVRGGFGGGDEENQAREGNEEGAGGGQMPGGIDQQEEGADEALEEPAEEEGEEQEEEQDTEGAEEPQPSFLQNLFGRFFNFGGGSTSAPGGSHDANEGGHDAQ